MPLLLETPDDFAKAASGKPLKEQLSILKEYPSII